MHLNLLIDRDFLLLGQLIDYSFNTSSQSKTILARSILFIHDFKSLPLFDMNNHYILDVYLV